MSLINIVIQCNISSQKLLNKKMVIVGLGTDQLNSYIKCQN